MLFIFFIFVINTLAQSNTKCSSAYCSDCESSNPSKCTSCIDNYMLKDGQCIFEGDLKCRYFKSLTSSSNSICLTCNYGYRYDFKTRQCVSGEETCISNTTTSYGLSSNFNCTACKTGYALMQYECKNCLEKNPHCTSFMSYKDVTGDICDRCKTCESGYGLVNGKCQLKDPHMTKVDERTTGCASGYVYINGYCMEGEVDDCISYVDSSGKVCSRCLDGGQQDGDDCESSCDADHCLICAAQSTHPRCLECEHGYFVGNDGQCYENPVNCKKGSINSDGTCSSCNDGFGIDKSGICARCTVANCRSCSGDINKCTYCNSGYQAHNGGCISCSSDCASCKTDNPTYCYSCKDGNKVSSNGVCYNKIEGCSSYKTDGTCSSCSIGYDLSSGRCTAHGCSGKNTTSNKCTGCINGYYMKSDFTCGKCDSSCNPNGGCVHTPSMCIEYNITNCKNYNENRNCIECEEGMNVVNGRCEHKKEDFYICTDYLADGKKCGLCAYIYNYDKKDFYYYWPDSDGTCGAGSIMIYLSLILLVLFILF